MKINSLVQHKILGCGRVVGFILYPDFHIIVIVDFGHSILNVNKASLVTLFHGDYV